MCLILFAYRHHPRYRLVLAANRDEFLDRPSEQLGFHFPGEKILAGKDRRGGGSWLGMNGEGRMAALTNYRDPSRVRTDAPSRGRIVLRCLRSELPPEEFLGEIDRKADRYNGYNLLVSDRRELWYYSNVTGEKLQLRSGVYALSNHLLNTPWPKTTLGKTLFTEALAKDRLDPQELFSLLENRDWPEESLLPQTGVGREWERILAPVFIHSPTYGTRSSCVLLLGHDGSVYFGEQSFQHDGGGVQKAEKTEFSLQLPAD